MIEDELTPTNFDSYIQAYIDFYDEDGNNDLETYVDAIGQMFEQSENVTRDPEGYPPYALLFNPDTCPDNALAWLGQFVGVQPEVQSQSESDTEFYDRQRQRIKDHLGFARGSAAAMRATAQLYLTGNKTVFFRERDTDPYILTIVTQTDETPDSARVLAALMAIKPAGIILHYNVITGTDFAYLRDTYSTFATLKAGYANFAAMRGV
jgi:hypothetical protein